MVYTLEVQLRLLNECCLYQVLGSAQLCGLPLFVVSLFPRWLDDIHPPVVLYVYTNHLCVPKVLLA